MTVVGVSMRFYQSLIIICSYVFIVDITYLGKTQSEKVSVVGQEKSGKSSRGA
jgi:hypothetical protein